MAPENRMFTWFKPMTAEEVAAEGYAALVKGKAVCVTKPSTAPSSLRAASVPTS